MEQEQIDKLRAAGYTDDDIRDFAANQPKLGNAPTQTTDETLPEIDVTKPSDIIKNAEAAGVPTGARESSFLSDAATMAAVKGGQFAAENPLTTAGLTAYGASYIPGVNKLPGISGIRDTRIAVGDIAQRAMNRATPVAPAGSPTNPIGATTTKIPVTAGQPRTNVVRPVVPGPGTMAGATPTSAMGPVSPVVPQGMPPAPKPPSITAQIRALAANKVLPMAGNLARGSVGPGMGLYSGSLNTGEEEELRRRRMMPPTISR
jgi:hypothetical protein